MQIYAELSKKLAKKMDDGEATFTMPDGVVLTQRHKGRFCYFECDGKYSRGALIGLLEDRGVPWQDNDK
jgi:hypothetical protein